MRSKASIRAHTKALRRELSERERATLDAKVVARAKTELDWASLRRVMVYLPITDRHEIDTWPLVKWIWDVHPHIGVFAPVLAGDMIVPVRLQPTSRVEISAWQIPEPAGGEILSPDDELELVLTPLLGFDDTGERVGFGGGYYDRFFAIHGAATRIGLAYEAMRVPERVAAEDHDMPVDAVVTELQTHRFSYSR